MKNRLRFASLLIAALLLVLSGCTAGFYGVEEREAGDEGYGSVRAVLPSGEGTASGRIPATVYFRYLDQELLAPVDYEFSLSALSTVEEMIVQRLIDGPEDPGLGFGRLFNPDTRIVQIKEQNGYLSVTLSQEFLADYEDMGLDASARRLAILSLVDSITELGQYSRVLVLVDRQGNGTGSRLTGNEAGFTELGVRALEPLSRDASVLLTAQKVVQTALQAMVDRDFSTVESCLARSDFDGSALPDSRTVQDGLAACSSLISFSLRDGITVSADGQRATATLDYSYVDPTGLPTERLSVPLRLVRENVWKVSYASLLAGLSQR